MSDIITQWVKIPTNDGEFDGFLAIPKAGHGPAVVILQEIFGVNSHIQSIAEQYAQDGYVALCPDIFWRAQPRVELGYDEKSREKALALMGKIDAKQAASDADAAARFLRALPQTQGKVAAIGYCYGGRLAYMSAALGNLDMAVAYYGGGIQNELDLAENIDVPMMFHYAGKDAHILPDHIKAVQTAMVGRDAVFHIYPDADHGFNCSDRASYNQPASALAHGRTLVFLGTK